MRVNSKTFIFSFLCVLLAGAIFFALYNISVPFFNTWMNAQSYTLLERATNDMEYFSTALLSGVGEIRNTYLAYGNNSFEERVHAVSGVLSNITDIQPSPVVFFRNDSEEYDDSVSYLMNVAGLYRLTSKAIPISSFPTYLDGRYTHNGDTHLSPLRRPMLCDIDIGQCQCDYMSEITYVVPLYRGNESRPFEIMAIGYDVMDIRSFFERLYSYLPDTAFIVDSDGYYFWKKNDQARQMEFALNRESSFFGDFPNTYEHILANDGGTYAEEGEEKVFYQSITPYFGMGRSKKVIPFRIVRIPHMHQFLVIGFVKK